MAVDGGYQVRQPLQLEPRTMSQQDELPRRLAVEVLELEVLIAEMEREQRSLAEHVTELRALLAHLREIQSQLSPSRTAPSLTAAIRAPAAGHRVSDGCAGSGRQPRHPAAAWRHPDRERVGACHRPLDPLPVGRVACGVRAILPDFCRERSLRQETERQRNSRGVQSVIAPTHHVPSAACRRITM